VLSPLELADEVGLADAPTLAVDAGLSLAEGEGDLIHGSSAAQGVRVASAVGLQLGVTERVGTVELLPVAERLPVRVVEALRDCTQRRNKEGEGVRWRARMCKLAASAGAPAMGCRSHRHPLATRGGPVNNEC
jgi:hypothetical protein